MAENTYYVYIIECEDGSLYTGIAIDPEKRLKAHQKLKSGAKYTKAHKPVKIVYSKEYINRSEASKEEFRIKQLSHKAKLNIIKNAESLDL